MAYDPEHRMLVASKFHNSQLLPSNGVAKVGAVEIEIIVCLTNLLSFSSALWICSTVNMLVFTLGWAPLGTCALDRTKTVSC